MLNTPFCCRINKFIKDIKLYNGTADGSIVPKILLKQAVKNYETEAMKI